MFSVSLLLLGSATKHDNEGENFEDLLGKLRIMESRRITQKILQVEALRRKDGHKRLESPARGRSIFSFAGGRKSIPSKWDEAERWLISSHCHQFPAQVTRSSDPITYDQQQNVDAFAKKLRARQLNAGTETIQGNTSSKSKCQTPAELSSPARHDTPSRAINHSSNVKNYQFSKHDFGTHFDPIVPHWSLEEEDMSWCFKHYDVSCGRKSFAETGAFKDEERTKSHNRYRREEAKIQAWVRLENVKAEAQVSKLEVKIQRMRYDLEVKLMKKMAAANRRAEEWRELAQKQLCKNSLRSSNQEVKIKQQYDSKLVKHSSCCSFSKTSKS